MGINLIEAIKVHYVNPYREDLSKHIGNVLQNIYNQYCELVNSTDMIPLIKHLLHVDYLPRIAEKVLERLLASSGCVLIKGPEFCGKSTLASRYSNSSIALVGENYISLAKADPRSILHGDVPRRIDEWQEVPILWDLIRGDLDKGYVFGKYLLTGSAKPSMPSGIQHSGAGRITTMMLRPLSLYESNESLGTVSFTSLFSESPEFTPVLPRENPMLLSRIAFLICRGGWPLSVVAKEDRALRVTRGLCDRLFDKFSECCLGRRRNGVVGKRRAAAVLKELARNISSPASVASMARNISDSGEFPGFSVITFNKWKDFLESRFIVFDMHSWNRNLNTSVLTRRTAARHFFDPSIATCALGLTPDSILEDMNRLTLLFKDLAARDILCFASTSRGCEVRHYKDSSGLEVDFIVELRNGKYGAIAARLGGPAGVADGLSCLSRFVERLRRAGQPLPVFRMVLTSHGACYKERDGTYVVPLNCLKP